MDSLKRRSRMISLRLSPQEYEELNAMCRTAGSRSISDFARGAMQQLLHSAQVSPALEGKLQILDDRVRSLDEEVLRIMKLVENRTTPAATLAADGS